MLSVIVMLRPNKLVAGRTQLGVAPNKLVADRTQLGVHNKAKDILLHLLYVCFLLTGVRSKVFHGAVAIYYDANDADFSSDSSREKGGDCWISITKHVSHAMPFKIPTGDTKKAIYRPSIRSALQPNHCNDHATIKSHHGSTSDNSSNGEGTTEPLSLIDINDMQYVWKLIQWKNGEATIKSLSEKKTRRILQSLLSSKNNWLSSMSVSLFLVFCFTVHKKYPYCIYHSTVPSFPLFAL
jgi:hypothetical protein